MKIRTFFINYAFNLLVKNLKLNLVVDIKKYCDIKKINKAKKYHIILSNFI
jgi:hypothetical protein